MSFSSAVNITTPMDIKKIIDVAASKWTRCLQFSLMVLYSSITLHVFSQENISHLDVDSLGDIWVFTLDKSASMLRDKTTNPNHPQTISSTQIANIVLPWLDKHPNILSLIDYQRDQIAILETGYGIKEIDSYGKYFNDTSSLDQCFIHMVSPLNVYSTNGQRGLVNVLRDKIIYDTYKYRESFVSQIRVLALSRIVDYVHQKKQNNRFRKIHLVIITDDADENDQWRTDYYTIKARSRKKHNELNALNSYYFYNSFTNQGYGLINERDDYSLTSLNAKYHIYLYDYTTLQQTPENIHADEKKLIEIEPLDGKSIHLKRICKEWNCNSVDFIYIDTLEINGRHFSVNRYLTDTALMVIPYDLHTIQNSVVLKGAVQVQYTDSIYGPHMCKIAFSQATRVLSARAATWLCALGTILTIGFLLLILHILFIMPNTRLMTVYTSNGQELHVRRGYSWQWPHEIISLISTQRHSPTNITIVNKHRNLTCFSSDMTDVNQISFLISSHTPLSITPNAKEFTSFSDINADYFLRSNEYPSLLRTHYNKTLAARLYQKRKGTRLKPLKYLLQICINIINRFAPIYYYYISEEINDKTFSISSQHLFGKVFLIELKPAGNVYTSQVDIAINTIVTKYYENPSSKYADCLIRYQIQPEQNTIDWYVVRLQHNYISSHSMRPIRLIMHYTQSFDQLNEELILYIAQYLKKECRKLQGVRDISIGKVSPDISNFPQFQFEISHSSILSFISVVESTEKQRSTIVYSPFEDSNTLQKYVMIRHSEHDALLYSSPLRFDKCIGHPSLQRRLSPNILYHDSTHDRTEMLLIDEEFILFSNILINKTS